MRVDDFQENAPGQLVPLGGIPGVSQAFLPDRLPVKLLWPNDLWPILLEARTSLASLNGAGRHLPNPKLLIRPLQQREALRSSSLEGTWTPPDQQALFDLEPRDATTENDPTNAFREVYNYTRRLQLASDGRAISLHLIRELHATLLDGVRGSDRNPGQVRTSQNQIGRPPRFVPPPAHHLADLIDNLVSFIGGPRQFDPLVDAFLVHYQFEAIHPFMEGNGRVGRMLLAVLIERWCGLSGQWLYMSAYFDAQKDAYMDRLLRVSTHGDWSGWVRFCLEGVVAQSRDALQRCDRLLELQRGFHAQLHERRAARLRALTDHLFTSPGIRVIDAVKLLNVSYPTARKYLEQLERMEILTSIADAYPAAFVCMPILNATYED